LGLPSCHACMISKYSMQWLSPRGKELMKKVGFMVKS